MASTNTTFVYVDPRLPVNPNMSINDPAHPRNLVASLAALEAQAQADTVYDAPPPKRDKPLLEAFTSYVPNSQSSLLAVMLMVFVTVLLLFMKRRECPALYVFLSVLSLVVLFALSNMYIPSKNAYNQ